MKVKLIIIAIVVLIVILSSVAFNIHKDYKIMRKMSAKVLELIYEGKQEEAFSVYFDGTDYEIYKVACKALGLVDWTGKYYANKFDFRNKERGYAIDYFIESKKYPMKRYFTRITFYKKRNSDKFSEIKFELLSGKSDKEAAAEIKKFIEILKV